MTHLNRHLFWRTIRYFTPTFFISFSVRFGKILNKLGLTLITGHILEVQTLESSVHIRTGVPRSAKDRRFPKGLYYDPRYPTKKAI